MRWAQRQINQKTLAVEDLAAVEDSPTCRRVLCNYKLRSASALPTTICAVTA